MTINIYIPFDLEFIIRNMKSPSCSSSIGSMLAADGIDVIVAELLLLLLFVSS